MMQLRSDERGSPGGFARRVRGVRAKDLARALTKEERRFTLVCCVRHPDAGGPCGRRAERMVYGLLFCEAHGDEAEAGALSELYDDAAATLEHFRGPDGIADNDEADEALRRAVAALDEAGENRAEDEWAMLARAYPTIPERADSTIYEHDYGAPRPTPMDSFLDARRLVCRLMRIAHSHGADWLAESLEPQRESVSAQAAFAIEDYNRRVGPPSGAE